MASTMGETIYESSDLPEEDQHQAEAKERFESEHIESVQLDVGTAFLRFKGKHLNVDGTDFSDSVTAKRKGYRGGSFVHELLGSYDEPESIQDRYNRLQQEILELTDQVSKLKESGTKKGEEGVAAADVGRLQSELSAVSVEGAVKAAVAEVGAEPGAGAKLAATIQSLREKSDGKAAKGKKEADGSVGTYEVRIAGSGTAGRAAQLEARLGRIESALGSEAFGSSLSDAVSSLERRVSLLDPGAMEAAEARLSAVLTKLNSLKEKREENQLAEGEAALVAELAERAAQWDEVASALPEVVARLGALGELHQQALQFAQSLAYLDETQQQITKSAATDKRLLQETKTSMTSNLEEIQKAVASLESRIAAVAK